MRFCPVCKSKDIENDLSVQSIGSGEVFNRLRCKNCGYSGIFFPEISKESKPQKKARKKQGKKK
jgi:predicted nucleic-acid-binding Zn-ribbon protein